MSKAKRKRARNNRKAKINEKLLKKQQNIQMATKPSETVTSTKKNNSPFVELENQAENIFQQWQEVYQGICNGKSSSQSFNRKNFNALNIKVKKAFTKLKHDIKNPTLILATTGTTSSGKSTIINLLCGADIMPRMSQEMSAGVVNITHSPENKRYLKVHKTKGALWECGEWTNLSNEDIEDKLNKVMKKFNKSKGENQPETPIIDLNFPIDFFQNTDLLKATGIPVNTTFKLMDLPGLRNQQDQVNAKVIEKCRHAMCLVAYDMQETDEIKRTKLVNEVLQQIKSMGGSPARMMFILNRIDVFLHDKNPENCQSEAIAKVKEEIHDILHKELPEHRDSLGSLSYSLLSSLPALRASNIKRDINREYEAKELEREFQRLIGDEILDDLPRNVSKWSGQDFNIVSDKIWKKSYGGEFFDNLNQHIKNHFDTLVLPSIVDNFKKEVDGAIGEVSRLTWSVLNSSNENYDEACELLSYQNRKLCRIIASAESQLKAVSYDFFNTEKKIFDFECFTEDLNAIDIYKENSELKNKIAPLVDWYENLKETLSILDVMYLILEENNYDFSNTVMETLPTHLQQKMIGICDHYLLLKENANPDRFETGLNHFYQGLNEIITETSELLLTLENNRIHDSMNYLLEHYLIYLQEEINKIAPQWKFYLNKHLLTNLPIPVLQIAQLSGSVKTKTRQSRTWWTLFIATETIEYQVLPDPEAMREEGKNKIQKQIGSFCEPFAVMIQDCFNELNIIVQQEQVNVLNDFEAKLNEAKNDYGEIKYQIESDWKPLDEKASSLAKSFENLK